MFLSVLWNRLQSFLLFGEIERRREKFLTVDSRVNYRVQTGVQSGEIMSVAGKSRVRKLSQIAFFVREKKRVPLALVAIKFGYSYKHFKYAILPELLALFADLALARENGTEYLVYVGESESERETEG